MIQHLETQLRLAKKQLAGEQVLLARLPTLHEDVRTNHERTIRMRIAHYEKRISDLEGGISKATWSAA